MVFTAFSILEFWIFWIFWIFLYIFCRIIIETIYRPNSINVPVHAPEVPEVPEFFEYDYVEIRGNFLFDREEEAEMLEKYLEQLQRWIYLNNFRPLYCLKDNHITPFFYQQSIKRISQKILLELFSADRDTRLKELLRNLRCNSDQAEVRLTTKSIVVIILTYFGIPIMKKENDGQSVFKEVPMVLLSILCSSHNLFLCDFMLHHLTTSGTANEIISKHDLNPLSSIDTSIEDKYLSNFLNQEFMKPVKSKRLGFLKRTLFDGEKKVQSALFKDYAENVLKDIRLFQTILTSLPEKSDDGDDADNNNDANNGNDDNNNDDDSDSDNDYDNNNGEDDKDDEGDEEDKRMKERLDRIKRMAGIPADEELEFATPIQTEYSNIRREEQGTDALNPVGKEEHVEEVSSFQENTSATPDLQSEQPVLSDTLKQHTRPRVERRPSRPLSNLVDNTESKLERDVPFVFNLDFVPSPISEFNDDDAPLSDYVPSPISDINDHIEIRSMVSGEYIPEDEAEPNADQISLGVGSISSLSISISSLERMAELLRNRRKADSEAERLNNTVENWINRNILAEAETVEIDIPRVVNTEEQEEEDRWEFLGFDDFDREGFAHFFFDLPRATLSRVLELREKMDLMKQAFRKLTSYTYISLFNQQLLLSDMSPESVNILEEVQMAYKKMAAQYIHYQTKFEEFELGFTILGAIKFVNSYKPQLRLLFNELRPGSELDPLAFDCIYETMCEGSQVAANLKLTWEKYVKSSSAFKNVQETYQDSIDNIEQEFLLIVNDFHELCGAYFASSGTEEAQRG